MDIGKTISEARRNAGLSQAGLAARLTMLGVDVTNQAVCKWENGTTLPNARQFIILCAALGIDDVLGEFTNGKYGAYAGLDAAGRRKLAEYRELLIDSGRYSPRRGARRGGEGAVRGTVEEILLRDGRLPAAVKKAFGAKI